jgi:hypothetical protein
MSNCMVIGLLPTCAATITKLMTTAAIVMLAATPFEGKKRYVLPRHAANFPLRPRLQRSTERDAIHAWHIDVRHHEIWRPSVDRLQGNVARRRGRDVLDQ